MCELASLQPLWLPITTSRHMSERAPHQQVVVSPQLPLTARPPGRGTNEDMDVTCGRQCDSSRLEQI
jgi:hypothetical protein